MAEPWLLSSIFWLALVLLVGVTLGIGYLTYLEWRDRRRQKS